MRPVPALAAALAFAAASTMSACGSGSHPSAAATTTTTSPPAPTTTTTVARPNPANAADDACRALGDFVELLRHVGEPASVASGQAGGMVQDADAAIRYAGGRHEARWHRLRAVFVALAARASQRSWPATAKAVHLPQVHAAELACKPYQS